MNKANFVEIHRYRPKCTLMSRNLEIVSDSKSCQSGLNWPRSGKKSEFLAPFWLVEGTLGIGWK